MAPILKCGLEVHQQLDTGRLFSRTRGILTEEPPSRIIRRRLRPVAGELGEFDDAALESFQKGLEYHYEVFDETVSLVETDDEPPQTVNESALETVLAIAEMTQARSFDRVFVMRKTVLDGSNPSGFQRTALVALGGFLDVAGKKIGIQSLALEEDAARAMEKTDAHIVYRLDRLGIPLIELATQPDITSPQEAKQTAQAIGELFRRTCRARRGLGSIRQDLNVSITGGARVEIKGVQELELVDEYVRRERTRQEQLIAIKTELAAKKITPQSFSQTPLDVSGIFRESECSFLKAKPVFGICVLQLNGFLGRVLQPNRRLGTEIANYVRTKTGLKGILHSDELPAYGVSMREVEQVRHALSCQGSDAFILVSAPSDAARTALDAAQKRLAACLTGVPEETRQALADGNTEYLRPLPGAARMYPETDMAPIEINQTLLAQVRKQLPKTVSERMAFYRTHGLSEQLSEKMKLDNWACFFEELLSDSINATFAATVLLEWLIQLKRENVAVEQLTPPRLRDFFELEKSGRLLRENGRKLLVLAAQFPTQPLDALLSKLPTETVSEAALDEFCRQLVRQNSDLVKSRQMGALGPLMGDVMKQFRGKISGEQASAALGKAILEQTSRA